MSSTEISERGCGRLDLPLRSLSSRPFMLASVRSRNINPAAQKCPAKRKATIRIAQDGKRIQACRRNRQAIEPFSMEGARVSNAALHAQQGSRSAFDLALAANRPHAAASRRCLDDWAGSGSADTAISLLALQAGARPSRPSAPGFCVTARRMPIIVEVYTHCACRPDNFVQAPVGISLLGCRAKAIAHLPAAFDADRNSMTSLGARHLGQ
jgi:hypothetical protein